MVWWIWGLLAYLSLLVLLALWAAVGRLEGTRGVADAEPPEGVSVPTQAEAA